MLRLMLRRQTLLLASMTGLNVFAYQAFSGWNTTYLLNVRHLPPSDTGHLVDAFKLKASCTSLAFSPTGEYLATATTANVGVDVWTNKRVCEQAMWVCVKAVLAGR